MEWSKWSSIIDKILQYFLLFQGISCPSAPLRSGQLPLQHPDVGAPESELVKKIIYITTSWYMYKIDREDTLGYAYVQYNDRFGIQIGFVTNGSNFEHHFLVTLQQDTWFYLSTGSAYVFDGCKLSFRCRSSRA